MRFLRLQTGITPEDFSVLARFLFAPLALLLAFLSGARADAIAELAGFSVFDKVDLNQLTGDAKTLRGPAMSNPRFQSVQSCWVSPGSPQQVAAALRNFDPVKHSELKVLLHANSSNFSQLGTVPKNGAVQWLIDATAKKAPELQISREEAAKGGGFAEFWSSVLSARASAGISGQPSYDHTGKSIRPGDEINSLLNEQGKLRKQFSGVIGSKGDQYWELLDVDGKGVLTLGASFNRGLQAADVLYYASGGYYVAVTLHQLWPVEVGGRPSTLVWRGDMISSAELSDLRGVERLGSESAMIKDISKAVRAFRRDSGSR